MSPPVDSDMKYEREFGNLRWIGAMAIAILLGSVAACGVDEEEPTYVPGESLLVVDGKVCGFFDPSVIDESFDEEMYSYGEGIEPRSKRLTRVSECELIGAKSSQTYVHAETSERSKPLDPSAGSASEAPGCSRPSSLKGWELGGVCVSDTRVVATVTSSERYIEVAVNIEQMSETEAADTAVRLIENLNKNVDRYDREHGE